MKFQATSIHLAFYNRQILKQHILRLQMAAILLLSAVLFVTFRKFVAMPNAFLITLNIIYVKKSHIT